MAPSWTRLSLQSLQHNCNIRGRADNYLPIVQGLRSTMDQILKLMLIGQAMARPFAAPPGIPADRKAALIAAFERTTKDPDFLAEAEKLNFEVNPVNADKLDAL